MDYADDEIVLVSAVAQYGYCPRRCALIHIECLFDDNSFTVEGSALHSRADLPIVNTQVGVRIERSLPLWSDRYGLHGKADVVEFGEDGSVRPVDYKRGTRREELSSDLQLCAQALCLEEMLGVSISSGAVFYHESRRRRDVAIGEELRRQTLEAVDQIRQMLRSQTTPAPVYDKRCPDCSMETICQPLAVTPAKRVKEDALYQLPEEEDVVS